MNDDLEVMLHGEALATLRRTRSGRLELHYHEPDGTALSLSMPRRRKAYAGEVVSNWIDNLVPDDERLRASWARDNRAASASPFDLLSTRIGEDCAGAVQFAPPAEAGRLQARQGETELVGIRWIEERLSQLRHAADTWQRLDHSRLMYSIGGLQPKLGLHRTVDGQWARPHGSVPTTHILKPAPREEWPHLDLNEHICLAAARQLGIPAARSSYQQFGSQSAVVVERFDRRSDGNGWRRIHAEDLCQALGLRPDQKTERRGGPSVRAVGRLLRSMAATRADGEENARRFAQALALNWAIIGSDAHAKNYTILHLDDGSAALAPLYDVSSNLGHMHAAGDPAEYEAVPMAMRVGADYTVGAGSVPGAWRSVAKDLAIGRDYALGQACSIAGSFSDAAEREVAAMMRTGQPAEQASPPDAAEEGAPLPASVRCNQRLRGGALCNRRLREAPCPLHPTSPGSRQVRARR